MPNGSRNLRYSAALLLGIGLMLSACAQTRGEVTPAGDGHYKADAWHLLLSEAAKDQAADEAREFCAQMDKAMSVRDMVITRELSGVYVSRWFKCVEP